MELALFKTFTVPSISKILAGTNEFSGGMERSIRRTEDTALLISELNETYGRVQNQLKKDPTTSKENIEKQQHRHSEAIQRMNELHGKYPILNGDYLYTLALFVFEPISWINRYEWRQLDEREINVSRCIKLPLPNMRIVNFVPPPLCAYDLLTMVTEIIVITRPFSRCGTISVKR